MQLASLAVTAILCNAGAQIMMKLAGDSIAGASAASSLAAWLHPLLVVAVALYGTSFILTVKVFGANDLTLAGPLMAGGAFALVALSGWLLLGERLDLVRTVGITLILGGILLLTAGPGRHGG